MRNEEPGILVSADWTGLEGPVPVGTLFISRQRGKELFAFEYDQSWLESAACRCLDPDLRRKNGSSPKADLAELWKRIAFSIAVSNTDDHLRNHGFLFGPAGWSLSPLYDVNPEPYGRGLALNISESDNSLDFALALEQAPCFMLEPVEAGQFLDRLDAALKDVESLAEHHRIPGPEIRRMGRACRPPRSDRQG